MITRLQVSGYKSLDGVDVSFRPLTVVFGPNAVGKSNLLDLLGLVSRMVTEPTLDQAFERHRGAPLEAFTFDERGLPGLQERESARFSVAVDVELSPSVVERVERHIAQAREGLVSESSGVKRRSVTERRLRYAVTVEVRTATGHLRVVDEELVALKDDWTPKASRSRMPFIELHPSGEHVVLRMEKQGRPTHEEVGQDRTIVSKPLYPPHYPHVIALREELSRWRFYFLEPSAMREDTPVKEVETLASNGVDIAAFYNTLRARNELQFRALGKSLKQVVSSIDRLDVQRTDQGMVRVLVEESGMPLSSRRSASAGGSRPAGGPLSSGGSSVRRVIAARPRQRRSRPQRRHRAGTGSRAGPPGSRLSGWGRAREHAERRPVAAGRRSEGDGVSLAPVAVDPGGLRARLMERREQVLAVAERYGVEDVRVFGSVARGDHTADSDYDLLVDLGQSGMGWFRLAALVRELEDVLDASVDLVTTGALKPWDEDIREQAVPL